MRYLLVYIFATHHIIDSFQNASLTHRLLVPYRPICSNASCGYRLFSYDIDMICSHYLTVKYHFKVNY